MIKVLSEGLIHNYEKNEFIYYQNNEPHSLYLVLSGEIIFKIYTNEDLLKIINGSKDIIPRKKSFKSSYSYFKQRLYERRIQAIENGIIDKNIKEKVTFGTFFNEEKLALETKYENCAIVKTNSILLVISNICFNFYLKNRIRQILSNIYYSFYQRFKLTLDTNQKLFKNIINTSKKLFPEVNEIIIKENEDKISLNLYFIYEGKVIVNKNYLGDILYLKEGEVFGVEDFIEIVNDNENYKNNIDSIVTYRYNIINKSKDTILFILDLSKYSKNEKLIRCLNLNLLDYFINQQKIIKSYEDKKILIKNNFKEKYKNLSKSNKIIHSFYLNNENENKEKDKRKSLINILFGVKKNIFHTDNNTNTNNNILNLKIKNNTLSLYSKTISILYDNLSKIEKKYKKRNRKNNSVTFKNNNFSTLEQPLVNSTKNIYINTKINSNIKDSFLNYERNQSTSKRKSKNIKNQNVKLCSIYNNCPEIFKKMFKAYPPKFEIIPYNNKMSVKSLANENNKNYNIINKSMKKKRMSLIAKNKFSLDSSN